MTKKKKEYIPIRHEMQVVETIRWLPSDPMEIKILMDTLLEKYGPTVKINEHTWTSTEGSWRTNSTYTVSNSEFRVSAMRPVYSDEDAKAMWLEARQEMFDEFAAKYGAFTKTRAQVAKEDRDKINNDSRRLKIGDK